jgi:hypothetical protein
LVEFEYEYEKVDPKPVCFCQTCSYGDMVAWDNKNCPIEWFHFNWVGLSKMPAGSWLCQKWANRSPA